MPTLPPPTILYRDDRLLAVDKPAGLLAIPSPKGESDTLGNRVDAWLAAQGRAGGAWPCHRIDRETSGLMLYAFGKATQQAVMELFRERRVSKTYLALANGRIAKPSGSIRMPIEGQDSISEYRVIGGDDDYSVVVVKPLTGRTNQIRIHFARIGHPLLGDAKFGVRKEFRRDFGRCALHAWRLELPHPDGGSRLRLEAPVPPDLAELLALAGIAAGPSAAQNT